MAGGARGPEWQSFGGTCRDPQPDGNWQPPDQNHKTNAPSPVGVVNPRRTTMLKQRLQQIRQRLTHRRPQNVVIVFADQWRGTSDVDQCHTPTLDRFKSQGIDFPNAISGCSQCSPYRGSLLTGLYPLQHGVLVNDACLDPKHNSIASAFKRNGYQTAYIGKWHVYGSPTGGFDRRNSPIPKQHRAGFDHWQGNECNHNYHQSPFFLNDDQEQKSGRATTPSPKAVAPQNSSKNLQKMRNPFSSPFHGGHPMTHTIQHPINTKSYTTNQTSRSLRMSRGSTRTRQETSYMATTPISQPSTIA